MIISLEKGQKVDLTKGNPGLTKIRVGLGWDTQKFDGGHEYDLDASVFLTDASGKVAKSQDFVYYGNLKTQGVEHTGDNLTGEGEGDDEVIKIDLSQISPNVEKVAFAVTIHQAEQRKQNFGQVSNAYIRVLNEENQEELIRFDLGEDYSVETALVVAELYRHGAEWKFNAIGSGFSGGLDSLCNNYGIATQ